MKSFAPQFAKPDIRGSPARPAIEGTALTRRFGDIVALDHIDISIRQGEFFSLLGPSGCGKTTLLRIIAGLDFADSGSLRLHGENADHVPAHQRPTNTVFQNYALFPHLTVRENVAFGLKMKKVQGAEIDTRVRTAMELVDITDLSARKPHEISGGQKQRVALARAIINEPKVLLLDEPLGALDLKLRKQLQVQLHELQRRLGITFIYVTHDQEEALVMSDRIAVMNAGKIEQVDTAEALYETPRTRFVAEFLGACNLLDATVKEAAGTQLTIETQLGLFDVERRSNDYLRNSKEKLLLAVRPEKILIHKTESRSNAPNTFMARIADKIYSGAETQFRLISGDTVMHATQLNTRGHAQFAIGDDVKLEIAPTSFVLLEK